MSTEEIKEDVEKLKTLSDTIDHNNPLKDVLVELITLIDNQKVTKWVHVDTSGNVVCYYKNPNEYTVNYQKGNCGNLVHELTHVSIFEAYQKDGINSPFDITIDLARVIDESGACRNGELRQQKFFNREEYFFINTLSNNLLELKKLAKSTGFSVDKNILIEQKIDYGMSSPHLEYDTVINQILVWCTEWDSSAQNDSLYRTDFYKKLILHVREAYQWRQKLSKPTIVAQSTSCNIL